MIEKIATTLNRSPFPAGRPLILLAAALLLVTLCTLVWGWGVTFAQSATPAPTILSVSISSDPDNGDAQREADGFYGIGDSIQVTLEFSKDVTVTGKPQLALNIGGSAKAAIYESTSGSKVVFSYTVVENDSDADGIAVGSNKLTLSSGSIKDAAGSDADLSHDALSAQDGHKVDGVRPTVTRVRLSASYASDTHISDGVYSAGEEIFVDVDFGEAVYVDGTPQLTLDIGGRMKASEWTGGWLGSFSSYVVEDGDLDTDGVAIPANAISLNGGSIADRAGNEAVLTHAAVAATPEATVDAVGPTITSIAITSDPGDDDTYVNGDIVEVTVTFDENVVVWFGSGMANGEAITIKPYLELDIGGEAGEAHYLRRSGTEVVFAYVVQAGDVDDNGIAIGRDRFMDAEDGTGKIIGIKDAVGGGTNGADLTHDALADNANHKVDGRSGLNLSGDSSLGYPENGEDRVDLYLVSGSDADITWSLSGDDSDDFSISKTYWGHGELTFKHPPNYEKPTDADANNRYRVTVEASDGTNSGTRQVIVAVTNAVFDADEVPVIVGTARVGETLMVDLSNITYSGKAMYYLWERIDGNTETQVGEITDSSYTLTTADVGKTIRLTLRVLTKGYQSLVSEPTGVVVAEGETPDSGDRTNSPATGAPTISGAAQVGETLTADTSGIADADGSSGVTFAYQWIRNDGTTVTDIAGATGSTYVLAADDLSKLLKVRVSFTDEGGNDESLTSRPRAVAAGSPNTAATGRPTIRGTAQVGKTLTVDTPGIADADGTTGAVAEYQWMRSDGTVETDIGGATHSSYTLVSDDEGKTILLRLSFTDDAGHSETLLSQATKEVTPKPNSEATGAATISGTAQVGRTLTADTSGIADADGLVGVTFRYQWVRTEAGNGRINIADIAGATGPSYTLVSDDEGKTIQVRVSFTDGRGHVESLTSQGTRSVAAEGIQLNSEATGAPTISGTAQVGETLTVDTSGISDADGLTNVSYSYQWIRNDGNADTDIQVATNSTYTLVSGDEGNTIKVRVSFTDDANNEESRTSDATATVAAKPNSPATGAPTISGTAQVGQTLTADTSGISDADGLTNVSYSYQWIRNDGNADTDIQVATNSAYTLVSGDEGNTIKVRVSFNDDAGNGETLISAATVAVAANPNSPDNSPATGAPTISGTAQVGQTLTADTSGILDTDGLTNVSYSYQWIRNDGSTDTDISGETSSTYTMVSADLGNAIKVRVSFNDDAGHPETLTSEPVSLIAGDPYTAPAPMRIQLDMAPVAPKNTKSTGTRTASSSVTVDPGTAITVTMSFHGLEQDSNQNDIDYIFRADVLNSDDTDADACEDQAGGYGLGVDRYMRKVDQDPEVRKGAISADCPAGSYTLRASLLSPDSVELATSSAAFTVGDPPASTDATLSGLTLSGVNFGTFASATTNYTANVGNEVTETTVTPTANDDGATLAIKLGGVEDADGTVDLAVGANTVSVVVTAEDGQTTKTYTVTVTRAVAPPSTDATLSSLSLWPGELVPAFDPAVTDYRAGIGDRSNVTVNAKANHSGATVSITPADADTDRYGHQVAANTVTTITIIAEDGQTTQDYTVKVGCDGIWCGVVTDDSSRSGRIGYNLYDSGTSLNDRDFTFEGNTYRLQVIQLAAESKHLVLEFPMDTFGDLAKIGTRARLTLEVDGEKFFLADTALKFFYGLFTDAIIWEQDTGLEWQKGVPIWLSLLEEGTQDATGKPTISGTAEWGQTLTASAAGIGDPDGLQSPPGFKYQWLRDDFDIPEANESTYKVKGADVGSALKVAVTFFDAAGNPQVVISDATAQVPTPACDVLWCALLTPGGKGQPEERGLRRGWDEGNFITGDALTDSDFTFATESYAVSDLYVFDGEFANDLSIEFTPGSHGSIDQQSTRNKLTLHVEDVPFPLSDAAYAAEVTYSDRSSTPPSSHQVKWTNVDLEWNLVNLGAPWGKAEKVWLRMEATPASDDATLNGLTLSGVDIGAFDPATTKYAAEVNHDVTETTVTVTVNDGGATYAAKLDGVADADGTLSLAEGSNVITIEVTAEDGNTTQTYTVTVTRAGPPLTARFEEAPATHNGTDPLTFRIAFSEDIDTSYVTVRDHALEVTGGSVTAAWRVESRSDLWGIRVQPDSDADVEIALPANRACDAQGAVCTADDKVLSNRPEMTIPGPTPANTPATGAPAITGTAQVGQTLTASTSGIADADGLTNAIFSYQWIASDGSTDTDIAGATAATYTLMDADEGKTVKVRVTFTDDGGNEESLTSAATGLVAPPPSNDATLSSLTLSGINFGTFDSATTAYTASVANDVTETTVTPTVNDGGATYAVKLDGVEDADRTVDLAVGANSLSVEVTAEDGQTTKTYRVTVTRAEEPPSSNPAPQLTARFEEAPSAHDGTAPFTFRIAFSEAISESWVTLRDHALEVTGGSVTAAWRVDRRSDLWGIRVQPDSDAEVEIALPANRACDTQGSLCTEDGKILSNRPKMTIPGPAPVNAPVNAPATGAPSISGTAQVGKTLTASTSGIADSDGLTNAVFSYQWVANDGTADTDISGATSVTYTLVAADEGKTVKVRVSFTDDGGNGESLISAATTAVAPPPSDDATLSGLSLSGVNIGTFAPDTTDYTANVGNDVTETTVTATANDGGATYVIKLDGTEDADGTVDLAVGANTVSVLVTAEDGNTAKTYRVTVTRAGAEEEPPPSDDATLSALTLSGIDIGNFDSATTEYTASVGNDVGQTTVTATANDARATYAVKLDGTEDADGTVDLAVGSNAVSVVVTAEDGNTSKTYTVTVTRAAPPSDDASLSNLTLSGIDIGNFALDTTNYTANVGNDVEQTTVTATASDDGATYVIKLDGTEYADGTVDLAVGDNSVSVVVTAEDGNTAKTYTVTVTRAEAPPSDDAALSALTLSGIDIGSFDSATTEYTASVGNEVEQTTVTATASDDGATYVVKLDGSEDADGTVDLAVGDNSVSLVVTAEDGQTSRTYTVTVTRAEAEESEEESGSDGPQGPPENFTGQVIAKGQVALDWDNVAGATEYQVQLWTPKEQLVLPNGDIGIVFDGSSATVSGLPDYASWSFKVSASGDWSPGWLTLENPYH